MKTKSTKMTEKGLIKETEKVATTIMKREHALERENCKGSRNEVDPMAPANFDDDGDCRRAEKVGVGVVGSNPVEDGQGKVAFVAKA